MNATTTVPARLSRLSELASDLWWTWNPAREVFRRLDYPLWHRSGHNPVRMLERVTPETLERAAEDPAFVALSTAAIAEMDAMRASTKTWWEQHVGTPREDVIAYFCAEFAINQSLPIYAGGLGIWPATTAGGDDLGIN